MAKSRRPVSDYEQRIKSALITQNKVARTLGLSDSQFTRKMKKYNGYEFSMEEFKLMEKLLKIKLLEPLNH